MPNGQSFGPYSTEALRQYVADGRIPPTANVVQEATGVQMALSRAGFLPEAPGPPAPPTAPSAAAPAPERRGHLQRNWVIYLVVGIVVVVIVIPMFLLAAILRPVFGKFGEARDKARQTACLSNIKQLALACNMYATDWNECLPSAADAQGFHDQIFQYVRNEGIFSCPSAQGEQSYAWNPNLARANIKILPAPMNMPMLWDAGARPGGIAPVPGTTTSRHSGGDNVGFVDGHAKWVSADAMSSLATEVAVEGSGGP
jgi:prepilin-type processing-associated H-X9-DG protein